MKMMPDCSTRSSAVRPTESMSASFDSSSVVRCSSASGTSSFRRLVRPWNSPGIMSLTLMPTSSTLPPLMISKAGPLVSRTSISTDAVIEPARSQLLAQPLARALRRIGQTGHGGIDLGPGPRRQQQIEQPIFGRLPRLRPQFFEPLVAHHRDRQLHQVADHRLDVAPDVADLGELRGLDLDEGRLRQPRQPSGDLGLAHAGRARSSGCSSARRRRPAPWAASAGASGCAARWPRRAWPCAGRSRACRVRRRSGAGSALRSSSASVPAGESPRVPTAPRRRSGGSCRCRCRRQWPSTARRCRAPTATCAG